MLQVLAALVLGIPALVGSVVAFLARKITTVTGTILGFVVMTTAFIACINSILSSILAIITLPLWASGVGLFIPFDFTAVLAAVVSGRICRAAYDLAIMKLNAINNAS
jgi:hypothetical protein